MVDLNDISDTIGMHLLYEFNLFLEEINKWKSQGLTIALCHGCFDPLHVGHVMHFHAASKLAEKLVVTITADEYIAKGKNRPFIRQKGRLYMVSQLKMVDLCAINLWPTAKETIKHVKPDYFVKGADYKINGNNSKNFLEEEKCINSIGGKLVYTDEISYSSTELISKGAFDKRMI
jgi:rfaE bifunctional protein nucleotidyltransferase chain/domain